MHVCQCASLPSCLVFLAGNVYNRLKPWEPDRPGFSWFTLLGFIRIRGKYMHSAWHKIIKIVLLVSVTGYMSNANKNLNNRYCGKPEDTAQRR